MVVFETYWSKHFCFYNIKHEIEIVSKQKL